jgi:hypothetical protein
MDEGARSHEGPEAAQARAQADSRVLSIRAVVLAARMFCSAAVGGFLITTGIGAISPSWGLTIAHAVQRLYLAPGHLLSQYLSTQVTIALANSLAALGASVLGVCSALLLARMQLADAATDRSYGCLGRASYVVVSWLCSTARRFAPTLGAAQQMDTQIPAAVAVLVPRLSMAAAGCMVGLYLAGALLTGWTARLVSTAVGLLPHGVCEVPVMIASAALGIRMSERLVAAAPGGLEHLRDSARELLGSPRLGRALALILAAIVIGAAIEIRTM